MVQMITVQFVEPTSTGANAPAAGIISAQLCKVEVSGQVIRSTQPFTMPLDSAGEVVLPLSVTGPDQAWHLHVDGVPGVGDRWVQVTDSAATWADLIDVDPA